MANMKMIRLALAILAFVTVTSAKPVVPPVDDNMPQRQHNPNNGPDKTNSDEQVWHRQYYASHMTSGSSEITARQNDPVSFEDTSEHQSEPEEQEEPVNYNEDTPEHESDPEEGQEETTSEEQAWHRQHYRDTSEITARHDEEPSTHHHLIERDMRQNVECVS
jgi:hypothetical protein